LTSATKSEGFTLLEVMITLVILSVSLLALAGLMVTTVRNNASGNSITEAATFAQDKMEEFRATPFARLLPTTAGPKADNARGATGIGYGRSWTITENDTKTLKTIHLSVSWNDRIDHTIRLVSLASQ